MLSMLTGLSCDWSVLHRASGSDKAEHHPSSFTNFYNLSIWEGLRRDSICVSESHVSLTDISWLKQQTMKHSTGLGEGYGPGYSPGGEEGCDIQRKGETEREAERAGRAKRRKERTKNQSKGEKRKSNVIKTDTTLHNLTGLPWL